MRAGASYQTGTTTRTDPAPTPTRPALARLLAAVATGRINVVAVYKIDRLSRSLADFARLIALFEEHDVAFVSVTQQFNSSTSMGKLTLNILMSFAEFEREQIAERTRDKMLATRRRGRWTGGRPPLGLDVVDGALVVNEAEAERVRAIFDLYLEVGSQTAVLAELRTREWTNKTWNTQGRHPGWRASLRRACAPSPAREPAPRRQDSRGRRHRRRRARGGRRRRDLARRAGPPVRQRRRRRAPLPRARPAGTSC